MVRHRIAPLSLAVTLAALSHQASAVTVYETADDLFSIGGRIANRSVWENGESYRNVNAGSRINLVYQHRFADGWTGIARTEWGFDPFFIEGEDNHSKRLLFGGFQHADYGSITIGKQLAPWTDMVASWTDQFWVSGASATASYNGREGDGGIEGMARADNSIYYKNSWDDLTLGLMYQTRDDSTHSGGRAQFDETGAFDGFSDPSGYKRKYTTQAALEWAATDEVAFSAAYTHSAIDDQESGESNATNVNAWLGGARWTPGNWYFAVTGGQYRNIINGSNLGNGEERFSPSARGYEAVAVYSFENPFAYTDTIQVYGGQNRLWEKDSSARLSYYTIGAAWFYDDWIVALEQLLDDSKNDSGRSRSNNSTQLLVRFNY
ncbi:porin [Kushneria indalinina]|uniref:Putative porin n=1 Tax=Kushneria indalinina DSM 14324 TaxID=1122140 RepID=A0A3D9DTB1_9GAMM|nr:porin [Kushneria indalinina]REC94020.1 putative porin [Kushneria indalinina DSM 14324]